MVKQTIDTIMGMPITVEIVDKKASQKDLDAIFNYFRYVDKKFSTYKKDSEISQINQGRILAKDYSSDMKTVLKWANKTKQESNGYFDCGEIGQLDPSGIVKGWAILNASDKIKSLGYKDYYIDAGGDISAQGLNENQKRWRVGIRNPFQKKDIVQVVNLTNQAIATSGNYARGGHIYDPFTHKPVTDIASLSVIGPDILQADSFATAAFAMGKKGIDFVERLSGFEGYLIDSKGLATFTSGFKTFTIGGI